MEEFSFLLPLVTIAKFRYLRPSMKSLTSNQNTQYIACVASTSIVDARICEERGAVKNKSKVPADVELLTRPLIRCTRDSPLVMEALSLQLPVVTLA